MTFSISGSSAVCRCPEKQISQWHDTFALGLKCIAQSRFFNVADAGADPARNVRWGGDFSDIW